MANFKKGVALVLAAATAFTFAPVSTLGTPVVAEAATSVKIPVGTTDSTTITATDAHVVSSTGTNITTTTGGAVTVGWGAADNETATIKDGNNTYVVVAENKQEVDLVAGTATVVQRTSANSATIRDEFAIAGQQSIALNPTVKAYKNNATTVGNGYTVAEAKWTSSDTNVAYFGTTDNRQAESKNAQSGDVYAPNINAGVAGDVNLTYTLTATKGTDKITVVSKTFYLSVGKNAAVGANIKSINLKDANGEDVVTPGTNNLIDFKGSTYAMNSVQTSKKNAKIVANLNESAALTYSSDDSSVATVDAEGNITAVGNGSARISVTAASTASYKASTATFTVNVSKTVTSDSISVKDANGIDLVKNSVRVPGAVIEMDPSSSTAATAIKTFQPVVKSDVNGTLSYALTKDTNGTAITAANDKLIASVDATTGLITAGSNVGTVFLQIKSTSKDVTLNNGVTTVYIPVVVDELPEDALTLSTDVINLDTTTNKTATFTVAGAAASTDVDRYTATAIARSAYENAGVVTVTESKDGTFDVRANLVGSCTIAVRAIKTKTTRATVKYITVNVTKDAAKTASTLAVKNSAIVLEAGKTAEIGATADTAITYTVADTSIATVDNATGVVTAVAAGNTYVTVTAATTDKVEGKTITVPVVVAAPAPVVVKPAKVTGVKVANVKGAKVKVSFKKVSKAAGYVVTYKIGKKSYKKTVTATSVKLSVKKGATVKVSVKAFNYKNGNVKQYGAASKAVSKKTDKK